MEKEWDLLKRLEGHDHAMELLAGTHFLGALIGAGASLVGGLFGASSKRKQERQNAKAKQKNDEANLKRVLEMNADVRARAEAAASQPIVTTNDVDVEAMMAGAAKAGFNPVTWLRNGGLAAYARSKVTGSGAMEAALAGQTIFQAGDPIPKTAPTNGEVFGNALSQLGGGISDYMGQQQQNAFQMQLLNAQLDGNNRAAARRAASGNNSPNFMRSLSGGIPLKGLAGSYTTSRGSSAISGKLGANGIPNMWIDVIDNSEQGKGKVIKVINPDLGDSEQLLAGIGASTYYSAQRPVVNMNIWGQDYGQAARSAGPLGPGGMKLNAPSATLGDVSAALSNIFQTYLGSKPKSIWGTSW